MWGNPGITRNSAKETVANHQSIGSLSDDEGRWIGSIAEEQLK